MHALTFLAGHVAIFLKLSSKTERNTQNKDASFSDSRAYIGLCDLAT